MLTHRRELDVDAYSLGKTLATSLTKPGEGWFFITVDFAGGHALENTVAGFATAAGGKKVGAVRHPFNNSDFSVPAAAGPGLKGPVYRAGQAGDRYVNTIKQAREFGIIQGGQKIAALILYLSDIKALGLEVTQGMLANTAFYWDKDDDTRAWSKRFFDNHKRMPNDVHAGVYRRPGTLSPR